MDSSRFDDLARVLSGHATRRVSLRLLFAGGLLRLAPHDEDVEAKKKRKNSNKHKKRRGTGRGQAPAPNPGQDPTPSPPPPPPPPCLQLGVGCPSVGSQVCCAGLQCDHTVVGGAPGTFCCQPEGATCTSFEPCCSATCDSLVGGGTCAPCRGRTCSATRPCCGGQTCTSGYCGGCRDRATSCTANGQCCFSDCVSGACLSAVGGRCARDVDCRGCYLSHNCNGACVNRVCTV